MSYYITILHTSNSNQSNRVDNAGLTICGRKLYMGPRCTWLFLFFCFVLLIVLKVSPDVVDIRVFCCLFVVCIYICSAGYVELPVVLLYLLR